MSTNIVNQMPYLRSSREFPIDEHELRVELSKAYIDTATNVNARTIGLFVNNQAVITGEAFYLTKNQKQQTFRQVYTFTTLAPINHNIRMNEPNQFTRCYGSYTDGTNFYGLFWATSVMIAGQITFYITPTQIIFNPGAGAPSITPNGTGRIILEWLSLP